ncbi:alpha-1,3-mannosyl-glycoprotein 4-beta-N-acetylglucosaminyltransferase B-like [Scleropages formosus]|uniref:Alpha-1,3-mannosyl-glycoprotein 4-beta-N-acetylglucosaminyltransferase B-like n=1 Tax=Scleropages formosus TaxID=113540 RepID=A0A0P7UQ26_SCLFO|nr:alpha-1,3-mannosyl-glycoprotein 4-beta-N-acetylglucosaminyltransferase B-like [Scleropages formosus]
MQGTPTLFCCKYLSPVSSAGDVVDVYQREFLALRERLHLAEQENLKRSKELNLVLDEIKKAISEKQALRDINRTWSSLSDETKLKLWNVSSSKNVLQLPSIFHHLPHLLAKESSLQPAVHVGQGRTGVSIVMGVPSVKREVHSYLTDTLSSLMSELSPAEREDCVIVVFIAEVCALAPPALARTFAIACLEELSPHLLPAMRLSRDVGAGDTRACSSTWTDQQYANGVAENLKRLFPQEIQSGLLEIISPSIHFYPDFSRLKESFGDPKERVRWRTKQNLDYCFLMMYAQSKGTYYVQLEDDIVARPNYFTTMKNFALQQPSEEWMILEFSQLGFIGKMFKSLDLSLIVEFMLMFYKDKPIDWLLDHIMWVKVCNPEKDAKHCDRQKANLRIRFKPSLFQHVGTHSSLAGKIQKLKDKDFGKQTLHKGHANPMAEVTTSLKTYQHYTLEKAYLGEDFFWAFTPVAGDFIRIRFFTPVRIERYFFRSGNIEHPGDKLFNTTVEVLPFDVSLLGLQSFYVVSQETCLKQHPLMEGGHKLVCMFQNGIAEGEVDPAFGPLEALRLSVMTDSPVWVILSEVGCGRQFGCCMPD